MARGSPSFPSISAAPILTSSVAVPQAGDKGFNCPAIPYPADSGDNRGSHSRFMVVERGYECGNSHLITEPPKCLCTFHPDVPVRVRKGLY